ncbi:glycosyl hydrolase [Pseudomonas laurylsulfativorans]|uniref:Glycosyl hydrolase n=1 Tax=Pseudomonas laurylsulfativorans TaxID=1943631 RepID=A0A2S3VTM4_9PSED|nr:YCF48-related protein [Pseudomonas laurylsulfativorans]POF43287.1 glycosyl hydrolase [Pseudomonas laurylsulfativorans]
MSLRHLELLAGVGLCLLATSLRAEPPKLDYQISANHVFLLNIADSGEHLVAVGERGVVMIADERSREWRSVRSDTTRTLSGVAFASADIGVAVGHGGTLIRTEDGGSHWTSVETEANGDSLLGVAALGEGRMAAWGAFGLYLLSKDNGVSWERLPVLDNDFDRHISQVTVLAGGDCLMVGESGTLARSRDHGETWQAMHSPYAGSLFGALQLKNGDLLVYGMRGNLWLSSNDGQTWTKRDTATTFAFNGAVQLKSGRVLAFGNSGLLLASDDQGRSFKPQPSTHTSLAKALQLADGQLLTVGDRGVTPLGTNVTERQE